MIIVRPIQASSEFFSINSREGTFFFKQDGQWIRMSPAQEKDFLSTNFAVGYMGKERKLSVWTNREALGLKVVNLEGNGLEHQRILLWRYFKSGQLPGFISSILDRVREGKTVTLWGLNKHYVETANLIARFVVWFITTANK